MAMGDHLRFSGQPEAVQRAALEQMLRAEPVLMNVLERLREDGLPQGMLVAGAIYNHVWNVLSGRPALHGINDLDVFYFDAGDIGYDAEDVVIRRLEQRFAHLPIPVQVRNQARVHLWFPQKFGTDFTPLASAEEMLGRYASKTHAVAARLDGDGRIEIMAPFGLDDIFSFRLVPNPVLANKPGYDKKAKRAKATWPELTVLPWT
jgi:hypothetical protein